MSDLHRKFYQDEIPDEKRSAGRYDIHPEAVHAMNMMADRMLKMPLCPLTPEAQEAAPVFFGKMKDAGKGDMQHGINKRDDDANYWSGIRKFNTSIKGIIAKVVVSFITVGLLTALVVGIIERIKG